jgi:hypothetical protein
VKWAVRAERGLGHGRSRPADGSYKIIEKKQKTNGTVGSVGLFVFSVSFVPLWFLSTLELP